MSQICMNYTTSQAFSQAKGHLEQKYLCRETSVLVLLDIISPEST